MLLFLLVFAVCLTILVGTVAMLMLSRTPRYRTEPEHLLTLFDKTLDKRVSVAEWHTLVDYPIRHDAYLESIRRRAQHVMEEHGRPWQVAQGGCLLSRAGRDELEAIRDHLRARLALPKPELEA
ncbi:hypothetical protein ACFO0U_15395 [Chromohalobacter sarecensis]|uniref:Uncharacterized protein n=1 Tax=Chromohalobacter sarecensis TaxID=245294 RepID=A0ABV9D6A5_9GAMM|nr:hypothetical protein [Chromohalobacter sarecensis]MCK0714086.1 hypothetical protein [Chromohalobacter sarecensis]